MAAPRARRLALLTQKQPAAVVSEVASAEERRQQVSDSRCERIDHRGERKNTGLRLLRVIFK